MAFIPSVIKLISGRAGKVIFIDFLFIFHTFWAFIVIAYYHGANVSIESGGIHMLEFLGSYLIARTSITNQQTFRAVCWTAFSVVTILVPFALIESISGIHIIKEIGATLTGTDFSSSIGSRLGLHRAYGSFDHPILFGTFSASVLGLAWYQAIPLVGLPRPRKIAKWSSFIATFLSLSSGALTALMTQLGLIFWNYRTRVQANRWRKLGILILLLYVITDLISNRSGIQVFLSYLTFSPETAYNRIIIFEYGIQDVWRNPWLGIGFNTWTRPDWMHSTSMDNFWLVQAVTFGIPGFLSLVFPILVLLYKNWEGMPPRMAILRRGWSISMIGIIVAACTVHLWNALFVYFAFLIGMGVWFQFIHRSTSISRHEHG